MGRPLNKRYFGNRNQGSASTLADNGIGGEGINSYTLGATGSLIINSSYAQPTLTIPAPDIPTGVPATASVVWEVESVVVSSTGTNYTDTLPAPITFTGLGGGVVATLTAVGPGGNKGLVTIDFSGAGADRGEFTTIPVAASTYEACTAINLTGGGDNGQVNIKYRVKRIDAVEKGSGYSVAPTLSWVDPGHSGTMPGAPTAVLTTDVGVSNASQNPFGYQENAIIIHANTADSGTKVGDIVKQQSSHRYKVKTADGTAVCKLVADGTPAVNEAYIVGTDYNGATYYVTKLTARRAVVTPFGGGTHQFPLDAEGNPLSVGWTFGSATTGVNVTIENG